jgi:nitrogen fixation NifU-like protein
MSGMESLYQQLIMDHAKSPSGKPLAAAFDGESFQVNPVCGDQVRLRVTLEEGPDAGAADGAGAGPTAGEPAGADAGPRVASVTWEGRGCSISQAAVSVMCELVNGQAVDRVEYLEDAFMQLMRSQGQGLDEALADELGDAMAFEGVSQYPARIKCALLGWMALKDALTKAEAGDHSPAAVPEGWS